MDRSSFDVSSPPWIRISHGANDVNNVYIRLRRTSSANCPSVTAPRTASTIVIPYSQVGRAESSSTDSLSGFPSSSSCLFLVSNIVSEIANSGPQPPFPALFVVPFPSSPLLAKNIDRSSSAQKVRVPNVIIEQTSRLTALGCFCPLPFIFCFRTFNCSGVSVCSTRATLYPARTSLSAICPYEISGYPA